MRIGIDIRSLSEGKLTGVEVYTLCLLKELFSMDRENHYILFTSGIKDPKLHVDYAEFSNVSLAKLKFPNRLLNLSFRFLRRPKIDRWLGGLDVFFSPRYLFSAVSKRCRTVITTHDLSFVLHPQFFIHLSIP